MKKFAKVVCAAGVLGALLTGVQTVMASPSAAKDPTCVYHCPCFGEPTCFCNEGPICAA
jgi:hypothetical protein